MIAIIKPSEITGIVQAPASKSSMQRACAAALLSKGQSTIRNPGHSNDDRAALDIIARLGASIESGSGKLIIRSDGIQPKAQQVNCGESGLSIRMFTPIIALGDQEMTINGEGSLLDRPMDFFDKILPKLGVEVHSQKGKLPISVRGPLHPRDIEIDGSLSSQFLTGLLMAYAAWACGKTGDGHDPSMEDNRAVTIRVRNLKSKPYIDLTLDVMNQFGFPLPENRNYEEFRFSPGAGSKSTSHEYTVEGDWSGGAFLLVAGAIAGAVTIRGLSMTSTQADKAIMHALSGAQASFAIETKGIKIRRGNLKAFEFDATDCPDLFPPLVALAAHCNGETRITGADRLTYKESNRAISLQEEFGKMGVKIEVDGNVMKIFGEDGVRGARLHSHHDHRIAMACAVAALKGNGETTVDEADAVGKSYPDFYDDLKKMGADVSLNNKIRFHE